ncbi:MAG TPA: methyltransferase [Ktedonobacterales bacterium]|nr:methyltransferase [Ktedonobacterales bacterium]
MSSANDAYAGIAAWYDVEHDPITEDVEAYASLIADHAADAAQVIEIGAGSGRVAAALAVAGHSVTAVEPSAPMRERFARRLAQLPERAARRITVVGGSAEAPGVAASAHFDVALLGQNMLAHLPAPSQRLGALRTARAILRPGGHLICDVDLLGPRRLLETAHQLWWQGAWQVGDSTQVEHFVSGAAGVAPGTVELVHFYDVHPPGGPVARTTARMTLALLSKGEVETALLAAGFEVAEVYGGYDLAPYEEGAARAIFDALVGG